MADPLRNDPNVSVENQIDHHQYARLAKALHEVDQIGGHGLLFFRWAETVGFRPRGFVTRWRGGGGAGGKKQVCRSPPPPPPPPPVTPSPFPPFPACAGHPFLAGTGA